jgi:hypothetical protein
LEQKLSKEIKKLDGSSYVAAYLFMAFLLGTGLIMGWLAHLWIMSK